MLQDVAAEKGALSGVFTNGTDMYEDVADIITSNTFTIDINKVAWRVLGEAFGTKQLKSIDIPTFLSIANSLGYREFFNDKNNLAHIKALTNFPIDPLNVRKLSTKLRKLEIANDFDKVLSKARVDLSNITGDEPILHLLGLVENPVLDFSQALCSDSEGPFKIGDRIRGFIEDRVNNPCEILGIPTGYSVFDRLIGSGCRKGSVNLIGARPKTGKTSICVNIIRYIAGVLNIPVILLDTEMSEKDHFIKMVSVISGVDLIKVETGKLTKEEKEKVFIAVDQIEKMPYYYHSCVGLPIEEILSSTRRFIKRHVGVNTDGSTKDCMIILDWIKLASDGELTNVQEYQRLGFVITALHNFIKNIDVANISMAQLNRDGANCLDATTVAGSDRLIWFTGSFSIFRAMPEEEMANKPKGFPFNRQLVPLVSRYGEGMNQGDYLCYEFNRANARIKEGPTRAEVERMLQGRQFQVGESNDDVAA